MGSSNGAGLGRYSFLSLANWSRIHIMFGRKSNWLITLVVSAPIVKILDSENAYLPSFDSVVFTTAGARNCRWEWQAGGTWALKGGVQLGSESE